MCVWCTYAGLTLELGWDMGGKRLETVKVSRVEEGGMADCCGMWEGDEVIRVNGRGVKEAGWVGTMSSLDGKKSHKVHTKNVLYCGIQNYLFL